jgi:peptide-methionine (S)-S-oxide reductase
VGVDAVFKHTKGVSNVVSGYAGGSAATAKYPIVGTGMTGHAESVHGHLTIRAIDIVRRAAGKSSFRSRTTRRRLNRQGPDTGLAISLSRSSTSDAEQKAIAQRYIDQLNQSKAFPKPIVTQVAALDKFYPAEAYHQDYLARHPNEP